MSKYSTLAPAPQQSDRDLEEYHDRTLWAFTSAAEELAKLGYTAGQLMRLVERHLTLKVCPFGPGESDPFAA